MAKRRTTNAIPDILGREIRPGNIAAVAVSQTYRSTAAGLRIIEVDKIYLDDSKGNPYSAGGSYFRDPASGIVYDHPTDSPHNVNPSPLEPRDDYVAYTPVRPFYGWDYKGSNEVVTIQSARITGKELGDPNARTQTYTLDNIVFLAISESDI